MIERLINLDRPRREPEYSRVSKEISRLRDSLCSQLDQAGRERLERLMDAYLRQEDIVLRDAFSDGFWTAVEFVREFERWKHEINAIVPPG